MKDYMTTTSTSFPVKDITHRPKRMQGDTIKLREAELGIADASSGTAPNGQETVTVVTLERAISYYKKMSADAVNGRLYSATAKWLEELLVTRTLKTEAAVKAVIKEENNNEAVGDSEET